MSVFPSLQANASGVRPSWPTLSMFNVIIISINEMEEGYGWQLSMCKSDETRQNIWLEPVDIGRVSEESLDNVREVFDDGNEQRRP